MKRLLHRPKGRAAVIALGGAVFAVGAGAYGVARVSATGSPPGFPAPGVEGDVAAMRTLPPATGVSQDVLRMVEDQAARSGGDPAAAVASLRVLLPDVGLLHYQLYAFTGGGGEVCVLLWRSAANCPQGGRTWNRGIVFLGGGGGFLATVNGQQVKVPGDVEGIVSDAVDSVSLEGPDGNEALPITNNAFFHELPPPSWHFQLLVHHADGSTETIALPDQ